QRWRFARNGKSFEVAVNGTLVVNDLSLALRAAGDGLGLQQVPTDYVAAFIAVGELETVLDGWLRPLVDGYFRYYPSRRRIRTTLKALGDFLHRAAKAKSRARTA